jgi:hypothetical protein
MRAAFAGARYESGPPSTPERLRRRSEATLRPRARTSPGLHGPPNAPAVTKGLLLYSATDETVFATSAARLSPWLAGDPPSVTLSIAALMSSWSVALGHLVSSNSQSLRRHASPYAFSPSTGFGKNSGAGSRTTRQSPAGRALIDASSREPPPRPGGVFGQSPLLGGVNPTHRRADYALLIRPMGDPSQSCFDAIFIK